MLPKFSHLPDVMDLTDQIIRPLIKLTTFLSKTKRVLAYLTSARSEADLDHYSVKTTYGCRIYNSWKKPVLSKNSAPINSRINGVDALEKKINSCLHNFSDESICGNSTKIKDTIENVAKYEIGF